MNATPPGSAVMRPIDIHDFASIRKPEDFGAAPMLDWLAIARLVVDDSYQRGIRGDSRTNIRRIAENFRWSRFAPVIVAPIAGGLFAIIDGQHRTTAAALVGHERVPCLIITADRQEQAQAFSAINGNVTRITGLALFKAAVAAREPKALAIMAVTQAAGVKALTYPKSELNQQPGETMAISALGKALDACGHETVLLALRCIRETPNHIKGGLLAPIVSAMCDTVHIHLQRGRTPDQLLRAFQRIIVIREYGKACTAERAPGIAIWTVLRDRLVNAVSKEPSNV